ncbi:Na+/H+ antiporter NhaC family protein [Pseudodesulfovibrio cashew]|uniref:Na+/H+ antiporter NhaC family protein n=1 Tax=Pseudodesulfovibrio cashew TaxID=2678688 RepID=A0A6I6JDQ0_9BACT|nr:Na+/H+ antiporter NhaC family protein [Pseudodesulfovibrio cashew]QGY40271.1 Na+/H+ antiporter NhaC family protein [Pseudodesulfovibrio cashew]
MEQFNAGWLSLLPPCITIILALRTKEIVSSLFIGVLSGALIYCVGIGNTPYPLKTIEVAFQLIVSKVDFNVIVFGSLLGALIYLVAATGGANAYAQWATRRIKSKRSALLATTGLGLVMFIDDYFNCLSVGTVMQPVTDKFRVSRAKLAYIIDTTAAPVCILAPLSSWAVGVGSNIRTTGAFESDFGAFVATIPWNFYAILSLLVVVLVSWGGFDIGPMLREEEQAEASGVTSGEGAEASNGTPSTAVQGRIIDMLLPIGSLILFAVLALLYTGGYWGDDPARHSLGVAFGNCDAGRALVLASFGSLAVAFLLFVPRGVLTLGEFMNGAMEGIKTMLPCVIVLVLAWAMGGLCRELLQTPQYIAEMIGTGGSMTFALPVVFFGLAGFLSFSTGTSWGTFGILIPIAVPLVQALEPSLVLVSLSAVLAGSVFGDHSSPISDTTILSSANAGCPLIEHVSTQMPYATVAFVGSGAGYLVAGITGGQLIPSFAAGLLVTIGCLVALRGRRRAIIGRSLLQSRAS